MHSYTDCIPCFVRQAHDALRMVTKDDEALVHRTLRRVMREAAEFELSETPPAMAQTTHRIIREESGHADPYAEIKTESTRMALELADEARNVIRNAIDPFKMAIRFSIAGNIMDFALASKWDRFELSGFIEKTRLQSIPDEPVEQLRAAVKQARSVLFLGDNAGEAVFDKLLIEQLGGADVFYAVKGSPVINDVTLEDAKAAGLEQVAELVENGSDAPGTILDDCSSAFRGLFYEAGLVIAKGQANYETLSTATRPVYFLTQVKCPVIGRDLGEPVGSWVVKQHQAEGRKVESPRSVPAAAGFATAGPSGFRPSDLGPKGAQS
ncbi:ARMT1-like domain-containing protein [Pontiellaceae bacterium B12227]|nr:ARMT1-like domain-containing protein [Pontiellaceae bacterium B12227]